MSDLAFTDRSSSFNDFEPTEATHRRGSMLNRIINRILDGHGGRPDNLDLFIGMMRHPVLLLKAMNSETAYSLVSGIQMAVR